MKLALGSETKHKLENMKFTGPQIKDEVIELMGQRVLRRVLTGIIERRYYSIMVDVSCDVNNTDQVCLVLRYAQSLEMWPLFGSPRL